MNSISPAQRPQLTPQMEAEIIRPSEETIEANISMVMSIAGSVSLEEVEAVYHRHRDNRTAMLKTILDAKSRLAVEAGLEGMRLFLELRRGLEKVHQNLGLQPVNLKNWQHETVR